MTAQSLNSTTYPGTDRFISILMGKKVLFNSKIVGSHLGEQSCLHSRKEKERKYYTLLLERTDFSNECIKGVKNVLMGSRVPLLGNSPQRKIKI